MLWQFEKPIKADLACRRDPHALELGANMEPMIQGDLDESSNLAKVGVVPNFCHHLAIRQIVKIELLNEGTDYMNLIQLP